MTYAFYRIALHLPVSGRGNDNISGKDPLQLWVGCTESAWANTWLWLYTFARLTQIDTNWLLVNDNYKYHCVIDRSIWLVYVILFHQAYLICLTTFKTFFATVLKRPINYQYSYRFLHWMFSMLDISNISLWVFSKCNVCLPVVMHPISTDPWPISSSRIYIWFSGQLINGVHS